MKSSRRPYAGFTLIELLVVVAIIAVLISILLPALARAREQAKTTVCLSNLNGIGKATNMYGLEFDDYPWCLPGQYKANGETIGNYGVFTETVWAGTVPPELGSAWSKTGLSGLLGPSNADINYIRPKSRPVNKYFSNEVSWDRGAPPNPRFQPDMYTRSPDVPGFFKCPSDSSPALPEYGGVNPKIEGDTPYSTWQFWGISYAINWYWPYYYAGHDGHAGAPPGGSAPYGPTQVINVFGMGKSGAFGGPLVDQPPDPRGLGRHMLKDKGGRWAAEFIIVSENRFNYAMGNSLPRGATNSDQISHRGWHKQTDMHAVVFMDGHATYRKFDTRYVDGVGWTTWPNRPWGGGWAEFNDD